MDFLKFKIPTKRATDGVPNFYGVPYPFSVSNNGRNIALSIVKKVV